MSGGRDESVRGCGYMECGQGTARKEEKGGREGGGGRGKDDARRRSTGGGEGWGGRLAVAVGGQAGGREEG